MIFRYLLLFMGIVCCSSAETISYNRDIRPILSDNCFACHGFDPKTREADLRLDTFEGATADNDGVTSIVPGSVEKSELWQTDGKSRAGLGGSQGGRRSRFYLQATTRL
jgi:hypothetical protein